ncbi:MAG: LPS export ABC transporter periplasmic protein LptC [Rhodobacteraceae bacterium]|nr:LPS export ABC transporter periplasmic protein LptC [Paracoccaceae bacterium]
MVLRVLCVCLAWIPAWVSAQGLQVAFDGFDQDASLPVEIAADSMAINQEDGSATLTGNVVIGQGDLRLAAPSVVVNYTADGGIGQIVAEGGVTVVTPAEEVEAQRAVYDLAGDSMVLTGDVLLSQGRSAVSSETMRVNLATGQALLEGRVRTVLQPTE